jgi:hypothetical protein
VQVADCAPALTPPEVARRYGVDPSKVIGWIKAGELRAIDVAQRRGGRPRYRILPADLAAFEARRAAGVTCKLTTRRRRTQPEVTQYF